MVKLCLQIHLIYQAQRPLVYSLLIIISKWLMANAPKYKYEANVMQPQVQVQCEHSLEVKDNSLEMWICQNTFIVHPIPLACLLCNIVHYIKIQCTCNKIVHKIEKILISFSSLHFQYASWFFGLCYKDLSVTHGNCV